MQTKRPIVRFFAEHFPQFAFAGEHRPNLLFRWKRPSGVYWAFTVQRDGHSHGVAVQLSASYSPRWRGEPALPWGFDAGLENLRLNSPVVNAMEAWFFHAPTVDGLLDTLREVAEQITQYGLPFLAGSEKRLEKSVLIQAALSAARAARAADRKGLEDAVARAGYRLHALEHPAYDRVRDYLESLVTPTTPMNERGLIMRLAFECHFSEIFMGDAEPSESGVQ